ncbi:spermidine/putrescine ABC transporter substrate-binding protein, partial [Listeria monocytogenes]|nr:spermidine/putrescine ABC transporter substrate-binding protein [Listeria monocytogenes]EAD1527045.1 spermidine/putrescine ABC transporter substrate-binding protein [Listeria monocytogenes]
MLNSENTTINTEYVSYATPNEKEVKLLQKEISSDEPVYLYMDKITSLEVQITL